MKPDSERGRTATGRLGGAVWLKSLPGDQQQRLPLALRQQGEPRGDLVADSACGWRTWFGRVRASELAVQRGTPSLRATLVGHDPPRDAQQPRESIVWNGLQPAPRHEKDIR